MNSGLLVRFSEMVASIYAAALQPEAWQQVVQKIAELHDTDKTILLTATTTLQDGGYLIAHGLDAPYIQEWNTRYIADDVWTSATIRLGLMQDGNVVLGDELVPEAEFLNSVFYREFLSRQHIRHLCAGVVFSGQVPDLPATSCSIFRSAESTRFNETSRTLHRLTVNHLSQSLGTMVRLRDAEFRLASSLQALDHLKGAVLLLGRRGNVVFANRAAHALLQQHDGISLRTGNPLTDALGWLQAPQAAVQSALEAEIRTAMDSDPLQTSHFAHGLALARPSGKSSLVLHVAPLTDRSDLSHTLLQAGAIVFVSDPQGIPTLDATLLHRLYGISAAESRVAQELLGGQTLQATAAKLHLGENTVKTHLQHLFEKTHTSRQQQLIRLLLGLVHH